MLATFSMPTAFLLLEWAIRLVMFPIVIYNKRRQPQSALLWLAIIFFVPEVGLLLYLLIGDDRLPRRRIKQHERSLQALWGLAIQSPHVVDPPIDPAQRQLVSLSEKLSEMRILGGNDVRIIAQTSEFIDELIRDIGLAKHHIHMVFYIFQADETGLKVTDALIGAAQRGVKCRVLIDAVGSAWDLADLLPRMKGHGIEAVPALPVNPLRRRLARMDLRNHRKIAVIDGAIAYTGSQNIVNPHYGHKTAGVWHDLMIRVTGPAVMQLQHVFLLDWYFETDQELNERELYPTPVQTGDIAIQTVPSGPSDPTDFLELLILTAIHQARRQIIITNPYVIPDQSILHALRLAVLRGVTVELVVPRECDHPIVTAASRAWLDDLLEAGVKIHRHTDGILHSKTLSVDDSLAMIGSGNMDIRSFTLNFEITVLLYGPKITGLLRQEQRKYIAAAEPLDAEAWARRPMAQRLLQNMAKMLSPLL